MVRSLLLFLLIAPGSIEGSHCMATDCSTTGSGLSLYLRVCCVNSNLGRSHTVKGNGITRYILCPKVRPKSCPPEVKKDCKSWFEDGHTTSGSYLISPDGQTPFEAYCDMETDGGGWTVFQKRQDGSVDFYRYWTDYEDGFGSFDGEFWLGLSKIHRLTKGGSNTLRVYIVENVKKYAQYSTFSVGDSASKYTLTEVGGYSGNAGEALIEHKGKKFTTRDNDNDENASGNCADSGSGAWWYFNCRRSDLNALYFDDMAWGLYYTITFSEMKVRRNY